MSRRITPIALVALFAAVPLLSVSAEELPGTLNDLQPRAERLPAESDLITEQVRLRYPSGAIKSERSVARTVELNYVNHGEFKMWDEAGNVIASGRFDAGRRVGPWMRVYQREESPLFATEPYTAFEGPFTSKANFVDGKMHGTWTISDGRGRKVSEIELDHGVREGKVTYYHPSGNVAREIDFRRGIIDGYDRRYDAVGQMVGELRYAAGRRFEVKTESHLGTKMKVSEANYLLPKFSARTPDQWWDAELATFEQEGGEPVLHGRHTQWYPTGQKKFEGEYTQGQPTGEFLWWHANGQVSIRGTFEDGKHQGMWHWWHPNGMKKHEGSYRSGDRVGRWLSWNEDGRLESSKQLDGPRTATAAQAVEEPLRPERVQTTDGRPQLLRRSGAR